ncbi:MAG: hypothetical protein KBE04_12730 [Phycisphaerae bacterium]|nr:hypothetical protein [Phycisphaerae bacterium]
MERRLAQASLADLPNVMTEYGRTGEVPATDLARAYVDLWQAFDCMADQSIGGEGYTQAMGEYEQALSVYRRTVAEAGVVV